MKQKTHDLTIVGWRAWYVGGRVFDSKSTDWRDLPEYGVLFVVLYHRTRPYSRTMCGKSLYWCEPTPDGPIYACDDTADAIIPKEVYLSGGVKRGLWAVGNEQQRARLEAMALTGTAPDESLRVDKD